MHTKRAKNGRERNARLAMTSTAEAVAAKFAEQRAVAMEMKLGEDDAWTRDLYESEYLWWWEKWNWEERIAPTLGRECLDDSFDLTNPLDVLVFGFPEC